VYSPQLLDHFEHPRNAGTVENPDACAQLENPACGDVLKLTARIAKGRITEIRFLAKGCVPAIACASLLTELVEGGSREEARAVTAEQLATALGDLPPASSHAAQLAIDALRVIIKQAM